MKKRYLWSIVAVVCITTSAFVVFESNVPPVNNRDYILEYGTPLTIDTKEILNTDNQRILQSIIIDASSLPVNEQGVLQIGVHTLPFTYKVWGVLRKDRIVIVVSDTISPQFTKTKESFEFVEGEGSKDFSFDTYFNVEDASPFTLSTQLDRVDFNTPGTYYGEMIAVDASNNVTHQQFEVTITKKVVNITPTETLQPTIVKGHVIENKKHPLPKSYAPQEDKTAGTQIRKVIQAMRDAGLDISTQYSGYRSYAYQKSLYDGYVRMDGKKEAERYSARPGYSEHQTGLAFDLKHKNGALVEREKEVMWLKAHAPEYGFIIRYPQNAEAITGYMYEPWHLRYVGEIASSISASGLTLEEYLGFEGGGYYP